MGFLGITKRMYQAAVIDLLKVIVINKASPGSGTPITWSAESHTFVAWGEFTPTLEDVVRMTMLPLFGKPCCEDHS